MRARWSPASPGRRVPPPAPAAHRPTRRWAVSTADRLTGSWTAPSAPDTRWTNWSPLEVSWSLWGETMLGTGGRRARTVAILVGVVAVVGGLFVDRAIADTGDPAPAAVAARNQPLVSGTPCSVSARSCVDLDSQRAWLIDNGKVVRGPVKISSGGAGRRRRSGTRSGVPQGQGLREQRVPTRRRPPRADAVVGLLRGRRDRLPRRQSRPSLGRVHPPTASRRAGRGSSSCRSATRSRS